MDRRPRVLHSPAGNPNAEAHTNPVYVSLDSRLPYDRASLDALVKKLDTELRAQKRRRFDEKTALVDYFERSRDILLKIREDGGLHAIRTCTKSPPKSCPS